MPVTTTTFEVDEDGLAAVLHPRDDLLLEVADGEGSFGLEEGPFDRYRRTVEVTPAGDPSTDADAGGRYRVTETTDWELAIPIWGALFRPLVKRMVARREAPELLEEGEERAAPWWSPPARLDARSAAVLSRLCGLAMLSGYLGTIITQTMTYAAKEFGASTRAQGVTLATIRFGVLLALVLMTISDRKGRHQLLKVSAIGGAAAAATGALSPSLWILGGTQTVSRGFAATLALLIAVVAAEEMPAGGRAYAASVLAMTSALGGGVAVMLLPLADLAPWAWRIVYVLPILVLPWFLLVVPRLPESRRFTRPHRKVTMAGHRGRLALLCASGFFGLIFLAPITQFQNDFLRKEHAFSAAGIALFTLVTNTPGGIGIVVGGRLADVRGRRLIGAIGTTGGAIFLTLAFQSSGPFLWGTWIVGTVIAAMCVPALGVYGPELFPTSLRGRANAIITLAGVCGSGVGLILGGALHDHFGRYGPAFVFLGIGPLVVAALVITLYPETAHLELEELNPEDADGVVPIPTPIL